MTLVVGRRKPSFTRAVGYPCERKAPAFQFQSKVGAIAGATAAVAAGVRHYFDGLYDAAMGTFDLGIEMARAAAHGISGGAFAEASGGDFGAGFMAGAASVLRSSFMKTKESFFGKPISAGGSADKLALRTTAAALIGGTASELGGGKFANGAATSAIQHLFGEAGAREQRGNLDQFKEDYRISFHPEDDPDLEFEYAVHQVISGSLRNDDLPGMKVVYGSGVKPSGGARTLYLNSTPGFNYVRPDHAAVRERQGENVSGRHASAIVLAHELGHTILNQGEWGAVTFFENPYRRAFLGAGTERRTYDGRPLEQLKSSSDVEYWNIGHKYRD